jgi:PPP family 3-phenylpropionic acid transporter
MQSPPDPSAKPPQFELRVALLYVCIFLPNGIHLPYFPLWLEHNAFSPTEIGVILAAPLFVRIFAGPLVSAYADRASDRIPVLIATAVASVVFCAGYLLPDQSYLLVLIVSVLLAVAWAPHTPLSDSIALSGVRRFGADYASMRVWGSVSFLVASFAGGYILAWSSDTLVPWLMLAGLGSVVIAALFVPRIGRPRQQSPLPSQTIQGAAFALRQPYFVLIIAASALAQSSHGFAYAFMSIYWKALGISDGGVGLLWALSVAAEIAMFFAFRHLFGATRPAITLAIGAAVGIVRWLLMPLVWPAGAGFGGFLALQVLHAFSFSLCFLATQQMFSETVPESRLGTAQGAAFFLSMTGLATVTLVSGPLYAAWAEFGFWSMALVAGVALALALAALRYPHNSGSGGKTVDPS